MKSKMTQLAVRWFYAWVWLMVAPVMAQAQWTGSDNNLNYGDTANWAGGAINDTFTGPYDWLSNRNAVIAITFAAGETTLNTGANGNAWNFQAGQTLVGTGIAEGTVITAITGSNSFTISQATTGASSGNYSVAALNDPWTINIADHTVTGNFTYDNTDRANVTFLQSTDSSVHTTWTFTAANPVISAHLSQFNIQRNLTFGAPARNTLTFDFQGGNAVFDITPASQGDGNSNLFLYADIINAGSLTKTGFGALNLYRTADITGRVTITSPNPPSTGNSVPTTGGLLILNNGYNNNNNGWQARINAAAVDIIGYKKSLTIAAYDFNGDMLNPAMPVNLYSGALNLMGSSNNNTAVNQTVGMINVYGRGLLANTTNLNDSTLTVAGITRHNFATLNLMGNMQAITGGTGTRSLGNRNFIKISGDDNNIRAALVGGQGTAGTTTISIIPWATAQSQNAGNIDTRNAAAWMGTELVTYTSGGGFRALTADEYKTFSGGATPAEINGFTAYDNLALLGAVGQTTANWTLAPGDQTFNALKLGQNPTRQAVTHTLTLTAGQTLTLSSGALLNGGNTFTLSGGILNTGDNPLILTGRSTTTISSVITNTITDPNLPGLIAANIDSWTVLSGVNTYGGMTLVQGNLNVNSTGALPTATELRLDRDGQANLNVNSTVRKLTGIGTLQTGNQGLAVGAGATAANTIALHTGGTIAPGDLSGDYQAGTLMLGGNATTLNLDGGTLSIDLSATANDTLWATRAAGATLNLTGATLLELNFLNGYTPDAGTNWQLTAGFTLSSGEADLITVQDLAHPDWEYTLTLDNHNLRLTLDTIPEPSTWLLLGFGVSLLAVLRHARRQAAS
jgi:hypothetical protein